jgi:hypothetical protein
VDEGNILLFSAIFDIQYNLSTEKHSEMISHCDAVFSI